MNDLSCTIIVGAGATACMDAWAVIRKRLLDIPAPDYGLLGRWLVWLSRGRFRHESIAASPAVRGERLIGWLGHYVTGVVFAALLLAIVGTSWLQHPTLLPALGVGLCTVAAPFLIMQPGMGAGIAASRTRDPTAARIQSVITHAIFGVGLYGAGWAVRLLHASTV